MILVVINLTQRVICMTADSTCLDTMPRNSTIIKKGSNVISCAKQQRKASHVSAVNKETGVREEIVISKATQEKYRNIGKSRKVVCPKYEPLVRRPADPERIAQGNRDLELNKELARLMTEKRKLEQEERRLIREQMKKEVAREVAAKAL